MGNEHIWKNTRKKHNYYYVKKLLLYTGKTREFESIIAKENKFTKFVAIPLSTWEHVFTPQINWSIEIYSRTWEEKTDEVIIQIVWHNLLRNIRRRVDIFKAIFTIWHRFLSEQIIWYMKSRWRRSTGLPHRDYWGKVSKDTQHIQVRIHKSAHKTSF